MKDCNMSCSNSRVALLTVKEMVHELIACSPNFNAFKDTCDACSKNLLEHAIKPLMSTYFNAAAKNFALLLTRRNGANKLSMKMVKDMKKGRCVNLTKVKNDNEDISAWTCEYCQSALHAHGAVKSGNKSELQARCELLKKLLSCNLDNLITLSKTELRSMSLQLSLPSGSDATKDDLIKNISHVMIHN